MVAGFLWERGWGESNGGNISANITHLIRRESKENSKDFKESEKLDGDFKSLAGMYFFVTGTGKRMRDISKYILSNSLIIKISEDGHYCEQLTLKNEQNNDDFVPHLNLLLIYLCIK